MLRAATSRTEDEGPSSLRYASDFAVFKPAADVMLVGHAYPADDTVGVSNVELRVGNLRRRVAVFGDRKLGRLRLRGQAGAVREDGAALGARARRPALGGEPRGPRLQDRRPRAEPRAPRGAHSLEGRPAVARVLRSHPLHLARASVEDRNVRRRVAEGALALPARGLRLESFQRGAPRAAGSLPAGRRAFRNRRRPAGRRGRRGTAAGREAPRLRAADRGGRRGLLRGAPAPRHGDVRRRREQGRARVARPLLLAGRGRAGHRGALRRRRAGRGHPLTRGRARAVHGGRGDRRRAAGRGDGVPGRAEAGRGCAPPAAGAAGSAAPGGRSREARRGRIARADGISPASI